MNLEKYRNLFIEEATDHIGDMGRALASLEKEPDAAEATECIDTLFRMAHSIKGMAASLSYDSISDLSHRLEDWMESLRGRTKLPAGAIPLLLEMVTALEEMVGVVAEPDGSPEPRPDLIDRLKSPGRVPRKGGKRTPRKKPVSKTTPPLPRTVRVRTESVDRFLAAVGDLLHRHTRLEAIHRASPLWEFHREFGEELEGMAHVVRELRQRALEIRTTPVHRILERLPRVATELAHELGKRVQVELEGEEVELDRAVLDHLDEPILHLVRNAIDHGIEEPEARARSGKPEVGTIRLSASQSKGGIRIRVEDDGRGVDVERVRARAVERGLLVEAVAEDLPPERILELVFEPGLTTRSKVTPLSGRGVGLDAVKRVVETMGGTITVESTPGQGSAFEIELISQVALQRVVVAEIGGERVAFRASRVHAVTGISEGSIEGSGGDAFFMWGDEPLPLVELGRWLGLERSLTGDRGAIVVVETPGFRLALRVDRVASHVEVFVREVPLPLASIPVVAGVSILPDGEPVFLLEVAQLVEELT